LHSVASGKIRPATTDASGRFTFSGLPKGDYVIQVTQQGFKAAAQTLTLEVRDRAVLSAVLSIGQVTEAVAVDAGAMEVQTMNAMVGGVPGGIAGGILENALALDLCRFEASTGEQLFPGSGRILSGSINNF